MPSHTSVSPVEVNSGERVVTVVGGIRRVRVKRKSEVRVKRNKLKQEERRGMLSEYLIPNSQLTKREESTT